MAKQIFHDLSELGVLNKDIPYSNADLRKKSKRRDKVVGEIKSLKKGQSERSPKNNQKKRGHVPNNKKQNKSAKQSKKPRQFDSKTRGTIINNKYVKCSAPDYQIATLMVRQHNSLESLVSYAKYYQALFGEAKFERILKLAAEYYEREKDRISSRFSVGESYSFKVFSSFRQGTKVLTDLVDRNHDHHKVLTESVYPAGKEVWCEVNSIDSTQPLGWQLELNLSRLIVKEVATAVKPSTVFEDKEDKADTQPVCKKSPDQWFREVDGLGYHKCGKAFTCNCCGRSFNAGQGYRIDLKEIYFCTECKKEIFKPSGRGYMSIVYTNMGHKR